MSMRGYEDEEGTHLVKSSSRLNATMSEKFGHVSNANTARHIMVHKYWYINTGVD